MARHNGSTTRTMHRSMGKRCLCGNRCTPRRQAQHAGTNPNRCVRCVGATVGMLALVGD